MNLAITRMDAVTQQNAALVEQATAASKSLEVQGQQLNETVVTFRLPADKSTAGASFDNHWQGRRSSAPFQYREANG
ncbi:hypothetical protein R52603_05334 [Paraburkholderia saeva]|nr:hypothetical protein R52603_05334 [Paraburkholderia saeva]